MGEEIPGDSSLRGRRVRAATADDVRAIAEIHVASWRATYRGLLPDAYVARRSVADRRHQWEEILGDPVAARGVLVIEEEGGIRGFASTGPSRDAESATGELMAIYLDPAHLSRGLGAQLHEYALETLAGMGFTEATLWVLGANARARAFYESHGWHSDGSVKSDVNDGAVVHQVRYRVAD
jgi:GNAT superfamily N-acetyltransferase